MDVQEDVKTIEDMWWHLANRYKHDVQGMVTRRGTLQMLTTRKNLNDTVGFARELVSNTIEVLGEEKFAKLTANHNIYARKPEVQEAPMVLSGTGRVRLDTTHFTEDEFKDFALKHGIPIGNNKKSEAKEVAADLTRPPKALYHKPGREPVEHDPRKMREGALQVWERFTDTTKKKLRRNTTEEQDTQRQEPTKIPREQIRKDNTSEDIARQGKMSRLENTMKKMKESQDALEASTTTCQEKITSMQRATENSMLTMSEMMNKMGEPITIRIKQLEAQAKVQVKQAEDIERIMKVIQVISNAVQVTPTTTQHDEEIDDMQIDIAESNNMKRKQTSTELTTPFAENQESTITSPTTARSQFTGMNGAGGQ